MKSNLVYTRRGSGEPVVLIHGIGHRRQAWDPIIDRLAQRYDVIAVDLAGFGESPAYPSGTKYNMDNACANLEANFAQWGVERPHVVGNSLGGAIGLELGARGAVRSVTALSPAGFFGVLNRLQAFLWLIALRFTSVALPLPVIKAVSRFTWGRVVIGMALYSNPKRISSDDYFADAKAMKNSTGFERTLLAAARYRFKKFITVPTTIAWGTRDRILPYSQAGTAEERLPNAEHVALPFCGHVPMVDNPNLIIETIDRTIARAQRA